MKRRDLILLLAGMITEARALRAQQKAMPVIGFLGLTSPGPFPPFMTALHQTIERNGVEPERSATNDHFRCERSHE